MPAILDILVRARDQASGVLDKVGDSGVANIDRIQQKMARTGAIMSAAVTTPLALLGNNAVDAASALGESVNAVNVVFGDAANRIHEFSKVAAGEAGLSMRAFNQLVIPVGASLQNVGFTADEAADASINLAKRAADMASVFDVDVSEALGAIQAGLRGEADPLERFGVGLSAAAVQAKAMQMGLADSAGSLDANAMAQARLALLMEQTERVAGDFVNTSDSLANSERINSAEGENLSATLGEKLLPAKQKLVEVIGQLIAFFGSLSPEVQTAILAVLAIVAAIGPLLLVGSQLITVVKGIGTALAFVAANPIVLIIAAIVALVAALVWLWNNNETFRTIITNVWNGVLGVIQTIAGAIGGAFQGLVSLIGGVWDAITGHIRRQVNGIIGIINLFIRAWNSISLRVPSVDIPLVGTVGGFTIGLPKLGTIPYLATGAWDVLADTLAFIHKGEMVVPRTFAEGMRAAAGNAGPGLAMAGAASGWSGPLVYIANYSGGESEDERLARMIERRIGRR